MANILLVDPSEMARRAMSGILARGEHRFAAVDTAQEAWEFVRRNVKVDLIFLELQLPGDGGLALVQRLKEDCLLKFLPAVIYTAHGDRESVKRGLELRIQNFLIKPYRDDAIFAEIAKTETNPWRLRHFEEEKSFCKMMGYAPDDVHRMLGEVRTSLETALAPLAKSAEMQATRLIAGQVKPLVESAEVAGAWGAVECLNSLVERAQSGRWSDFTASLDTLNFAAQIIRHHLDASIVPDGFLSQEENDAEARARELAVWSNAPAEGRCPVLDWKRLQREIDELPGCPIIDSAAASFQMAANGSPSCINPLMDLVARDPGLSVQMLIAANKARQNDDHDFTAIEDPRLAVGQLGELRLEALARNLLTVPQRVFNLPPAFSWPRFWTFQRGVARIAQLTCQYLEFYSLEPVARTAGELHDAGKLLLAHLHPVGLQAILGHARQHGVSLREAEKLFLGCTTSEMAAYFADRFGLPRRFANVLRWIDDPAQATEDAQLVAILSLARDLCRQNRVGTSGDPSLGHAVPIEETAAWSVLRESLFPSFNLRTFEQKVHADCRQLQLEFAGREANLISSIAETAAV